MLKIITVYFIWHYTMMNYTCVSASSLKYSPQLLDMLLYLDILSLLHIKHAVSLLLLKTVFIKYQF